MPRKKVLVLVSNLRKTIGKTIGKTMGKPWENGGLTGFYCGLIGLFYCDLPSGNLFIYSDVFTLKMVIFQFAMLNFQMVRKLDCH